MKNWELRRSLGKGSYGQVFLASPENELPESTTSVAAVKVAKYSKKNLRVSSLKAEGKFLAQLKGHPNIVQCFGEDNSLCKNDDESSNEAYSLLLEYATEGSLHDLIKKAYHREERGLPEKHVACYTRMLLRGLVGIHSKGIIHCDLKPGNILVFAAPGANETGKVLKLADFGLAKRAGYDYDDQVPSSNDCEYHTRGTPIYASPESVRYGDYEPSMDIWSLGCIVYEMLTGNRVWRKTESEADLFDQVLRESADLEKIRRRHSEEAVDFLTICLEKSPENRWTPQRLLKHPFIVKDLKKAAKEEKAAAARFCTAENPFGRSCEWISTRHLFTEGVDAEVTEQRERPASSKGNKKLVDWFRSVMRIKKTRGYSFLKGQKKGILL